MSLQNVKVSRQEILKIVKENKEKHDIILKGAIEGYWMDAEAYIKKYEKEQSENINKKHKDALKLLRKQRKDSLKVLKENVKHDMGQIANKDTSKVFRIWNGKYPENHSDDYNGTIRRLELCVEKEINLDTNEFDSYIRNKWTWRDQFLKSNNGYISSYLTASYSVGNFGTGSYITQLSSSAVTF